MSRRVVWMSASVVVLAIVVGVLVAMLGSPIRTSGAIHYASLIDDDRIEVGLACGTGVVWDAEESPDRVVVDVRLFHQPGDCAAGAVIELTESLGDRQLIDAATGDEVVVTNR